MNVFPKTYRTRLIGYCLLLVVFLSFTLLYSYRSSRQLMLEEVAGHVSSAAAIKNAEFQRLGLEVNRYAMLISRDVRIRAVLSDFGESVAEKALISRLFSDAFAWLPVHRVVILGANGHVVLGESQRDVLDFLAQREPDRHYSALTYFFGHDGLELMTVEPIEHNGELLGEVVLSVLIDQQWVDRHRIRDAGHMFIVRNGRIHLSTLENAGGLLFLPQRGFVALNEDTFRVQRLSVDAAVEDGLEVWFGLSETRLLHSLDRHNRLLLTVMVLGILAILATGLFLIRGFNKPLRALMDMTQQIAGGRLPAVAKRRVKSEIDMLSNQFVDMVQALRQKDLEVERAYRELERSAITDILTGLYNRRHLLEFFPKLFAQSRRDHTVVSAVMFDLDHFKILNDRYGHLAGDEALRFFAQTLKQHSRGNDFLYRVGGEEFLLLSIAREAGGSIALAEKIRLATETSEARYNNVELHLTVSCGVSHIAEDDVAHNALSQLLSRADTALYSAKQQGRNQVRVYQGGRCVKPEELLGCIANE